MHNIIRQLIYNIAPNCSKNTNYNKNHEYVLFWYEVIINFSYWRRSSKNMTSKTDSPPPYEDAQHHPKYGSYPLQPQQGSHVPPPSYSPNPGMCPSLPGYWGQEGVYPPAGMWAAPGFHPSGGPTTVPALSAGASNTGRLRWSSPSLCCWHYLLSI